MNIKLIKSSNVVNTYKWLLCKGILHYSCCGTGSISITGSIYIFLLILSSFTRWRSIRLCVPKLHSVKISDKIFRILLRLLIFVVF